MHDVNTEKLCRYVFIIDLDSGTICPSLKRQENKKSKINEASKFVFDGQEQKKP